ncbi:peptidylprolyl isomerase, partial [Planctomycetota bacterium]
KYYYLITIISLLIIGCESSGTTGLTNSELARIAQTQNIEIAESAGVPVLMVGGQSLSSDEIIQTRMELGDLYASPLEYFKPVAELMDIEVFKEQARLSMREILIERISSLLLYQHAKREAGETILEYIDKAAESELRQLDTQFGGDRAKADETLRENGLDRSSYLERKKQAILVQWYISSKTPDTSPTYRELIEQYEIMKDQSFSIENIIQFRLIDIQPAKLELTEQNQDRQSLAEDMIVNLLQRIKAGEDFGQLAKEYSHGPMKDLDGLWKPVNPESLAGSYSFLAEAAEDMNQGDISDVIIAPDHFFIMKLENKQMAGYIPFEQVQDQVRQEVLLSRRSNVLEQLNSRIRAQADIAETNRFVEFCLEEVHRLSKQEG